MRSMWHQQEQKNFTRNSFKFNLRVFLIVTPHTSKPPFSFWVCGAVTARLRSTNPLSRRFFGGTLKKSTKLVALLAAATLSIGVAVAPSATAATKTKACIALDTGGVDDKSFNASSWAGAQGAAKANKNISVSYLPAASQADYAPNIKKFVDQKCNLIIGVGFAISSAIVASAKANPTVKYAVVDDAALDCNADYSVCKPVKNVKGLTFATDQSAFLAGYVAAGYSKTGKVATYGGAGYPTVTIFMDGFARGVDYYNKAKGTKVAVLGWDTVKKDGEFVGDFSSTAKALQISKNFEQAGADVILPVAGGLGAATAQNSAGPERAARRGA